MMKLRINPFVVTDLKEIRNFIAEDNELKAIEIINNIYDKFEYSKRLFSHFFCSKMDDKERWDFIEAYFLGEKEENLMLYGN